MRTGLYSELCQLETWQPGQFANSENEIVANRKRQVFEEGFQKFEGENTSTFFTLPQLSLQQYWTGT